MLSDWCMKWVCKTIFLSRTWIKYKQQIWTQEFDDGNPPASWSFSFFVLAWVEWNLLKPIFVQPDDLPLILHHVSKWGNISHDQTCFYSSLENRHLEWQWLLFTAIMWCWDKEASPPPHTHTTGFCQFSLTWLWSAEGYSGRHLFKAAWCETTQDHMIGKQVSQPQGHFLAQTHTCALSVEPIHIEVLFYSQILYH